MCQDPTTTYLCGHTIRGSRITCGRPWAPLLHIIRATSATLPTSCPPCSKSAPALVYPSVPPPPYSSAVTLPLPLVAAPQMHYQYRSIPTYAYPTYTSAPIYHNQCLPQVPCQTPCIFQSPPYMPMPGPGSFRTSLPAPGNVPREVRWEKRSNGTYHQAVHYHFNSAPNPTPLGTRGYNTFHGFDTGYLPPGWGAASAPLPLPLPVIGSTPINIIPPNMILGIPAPVPPAVTAPIPPNTNLTQQATPAASRALAPPPAPPASNDTAAATPTPDTSAESPTTSPTETSTNTSGSSTSTSTSASGTSTPTSDSRPATPNTGRVRPAVNARVRFSPDTRGGST